MNKSLSLLLALALGARLQHFLTRAASAPQRARIAAAEHQPWMNPGLSPDERADMVLKQLTLDEKIDLLHGNGMPGWGKPRPNAYLGNGGAGFTLGVPRLGIPMIQMSDAAYGVRSSAENGRYSTALPSNLGSAASWDPQAACDYGALIGRELRAQGYNMTLGGGTNLTREPRNGRTFEYMGEDPVLAGTMVGNRIKCEQAQHVIGDIKHYAMNDQESGRNEVDSIIGKRAMRESDLLAFEIGLKVGDPQAVMCSYNAVNGDYACENKYLLTDVLKKDWNFKGFVLSDWGGTHSTVKASAAGLDNEEPEDLFYGAKLKEAVRSSQVPMSEIDDHARRVLRAEFAAGSRRLSNTKKRCRCARRSRRGPPNRGKQHRSAEKRKQHSSARSCEGAFHRRSGSQCGYRHDLRRRLRASRSSGPTAGKVAGARLVSDLPAKGHRCEIARVTVRYGGSEPAAAAQAAKNADVAIVFAYQWESEGMDLPDLSLPDNQDALIEQVAAANPHTIVVLETGTAVTMPWFDKVQGVVEAWYAGSDGAHAVSNVLFGDVNPTAKLPMTFPRSVADLPHPQLVTPPPGSTGKAAVQKTGEAKPTFSVHYDEGVKVGYKWYDAEHKPVLFPFGYGLSYTTYRYSGLKLGDRAQSVTFTVTNTGKRAGTEIAEVYAGLPAAAEEPPKRLVGWERVALQPGESREVTVAIDPKYLSIYNDGGNEQGWKLLPGRYTFLVGGSSQDLPLKQETTLR